jgi:3-oxoacyl-(acyl-carrier-protein) synthase
MTECVRAMRGAVADAGLSTEEIDLVHYHGTGTPLNDAAETRAVRRALGAHAERVIGCSVKGAIGHPQGASGLAALVATVGAMNGMDGGLGGGGGGGGAFAPPTINLLRPDPECDLDYTPERARALAKGDVIALINCLAFGAKNSALVVRGAE